jgi:hypothetical protein
MVNTTLSFLRGNWKSIIQIAGGLWIAFCLMTHCGSDPSIKGNSRTITKKRDTLWLPADTNKILALHGFDTIADNVVFDEEPKWIPPYGS